MRSAAEKFAAQAAGSVMEMGVRVRRRDADLECAMTIEAENLGLTMIEPYNGMIVMHPFRLLLSSLPIACRVFYFFSRRLRT